MTPHRSRRLALTAALATTTLAGTTLAATLGTTPANAATGTVTRASLTATDGQIKGASMPSVRQALSGNGNVVAFASESPGVVKGDTNQQQDAFARNLRTGRTVRVSVNSAGKQANDASSNPVVSADGRHVAFESWATNLAGKDTRINVDVFMRNLVTKKTVRVSVSRTGGQGNGNSFFPVVSGDGRFVAYQSDSSNLVTGDTNRHEDVFVRDLRTGRTTRVSVNSRGKQFPGISLEPSISANGRYVLFAMTPDGDGLADLFVRDRRLGTTKRVFSYAKYDNALVGSWNISANGRYVSFMTDAALVADDTNRDFDAYRVTVGTGAVVRASLADDDGQRGGVTGRVAISGDGNRIAFSTENDGYVAGDTGHVSDVFVRDIKAGTTVKVSTSRTGGQADDHSGFQGYLALSQNGGAVSFESGASNLVRRDTNNAPDVFVWRG